MTGRGRPRPASPGLQQAHDVAADLAALETELTGLRVHWSGAATEAYQSAQEQWRAAVQDLTSVLSARPAAVPDPAPASRPAPARRERDAPRWA